MKTQDYAFNVYAQPICEVNKIRQRQNPIDAHVFQRIH